MPAQSWKGYLKLSLVSCAVAMIPATSQKEKIRFHNLNKETGNRLKQQLIDAETGDVVEREDVVSGYEIEKGRYIFVEDEDIESIALESKHTIDIERFVPRAELDVVYKGDDHYLVPDDDATMEAFAVIRDAMAENDMVGVARIIMNKRERWVVISPLGKGMLVTTQKYPYEVRSEDAVFERIDDEKPNAQSVKAMVEIMRQMTGKFSDTDFTDRYQKRLADMLSGKKAPKREHKEPAQERERPNVVNLMDVLKRSIDQEKGAARRPKAGKAKAGGRKKSA